MVDKPCNPNHEMIRDIIDSLYFAEHITVAEYGILSDYVNDCQCLLDPALGDCNDKERR